MTTWIIAICLSMGVLSAQTPDAAPSKQELSELTAKAIQKVDSIAALLSSEDALFKKIAPAALAAQLDAIAAFKKLSDGVVNNGVSAYKLVAVLITLDDISRNTFRISLPLYAHSLKNPAAGGVLAVLLAAEQGCNDVSELLFHATMRLINAEESILTRLTPKN